MSIIKKLYVIMSIMCVCLLIFIPIKCNAASTMDDVISAGDSFLNSGDGSSTINTGELKEASMSIYNILLYIGIAASVIVGAILGIKIMIASADEKAKVKEALVPYIIGCFVIFGAFGIWKLAVNIFSSMG